MALACAPPVSSFFSAIPPSVLPTASAPSVSPCLRVLFTVSARSTPPLLRASECCPPSVPNPFLRASECCRPSTASVRSVSLFLHALHPQSAVHRQCPQRSSVPQSAVHPKSAVHPQSAVHRQYPFSSSVPQSVVVSARSVPPFLRASECCPSVPAAFLRASVLSIVS